MLHFCCIVIQNFVLVLDWFRVVGVCYLKSSDCSMVDVGLNQESEHYTTEIQRDLTLTS